MKLQWCWRCKMELPMLDEEEFSKVLAARGKSLEQKFAPLLAEYERITGFRETNPNAVYHHRLSLYGPACSKCAKPLRTPAARICAACGQRVELMDATPGSGS